MQIDQMRKDGISESLIIIINLLLLCQDQDVRACLVLLASFFLPPLSLIKGIGSKYKQ